ncbi:hypothetical protein RDWZM_002646, partial [Blomia tropicalis]
IEQQQQQQQQQQEHEWRRKSRRVLLHFRVNLGLKCEIRWRVAQLIAIKTCKDKM